MANYLVMTGGSHGIGEKSIALFLRQGWQAINISRTNCKIPGVLNINIDLSESDWSGRFHSILQSHTKQADKLCIVHNAALFKRDHVETLKEDAFREVLNVNLISPVTLNRILLPHMRKGSSIIYIGSTLSEQAVANRASYVISKHALIGLMRSTCQDLAGRDIHTACVCPGFVNTKMLLENVHNTAEFKQFIDDKVILKRLAEPEEVAQLIYFCAENPLINGSVLHANLGQVTT